MRIFVLRQLLVRHATPLIPLYIFLKLKKTQFNMKGPIFMNICRRLLCLLLHSGLSNCKIVGDNNCFSGTFLNDFLVCFIVSCRRFIYLRKITHLLRSILFLNHLTSFPSNPHGADILLTTC